MAEEEKHTPGPWAFDRDWNRIPTIIGADGSLVADIRKSSVNEGGWVVDMPEREANARLIAAAPDLLHELQEVLEWALVEKAPLREQEIQSIRAAIDKAKGLTPQ